MSRFTRNPEFEGVMRRRAAERVIKAAGVVRDRAVRLIEQPGTGEQHRGTPWRSSAPGEPPASQSGELARSLQTYGPVHAEAGVSAAAGTDLYRAVWLEAGTATRAPRPFLLPALVESKDGVLREMRGGHG